ncbi:MAG: hypothetical protein B6244_13500, partial [Candidatus Cloacimonetes bacterium 4572_55]
LNDMPEKLKKESVSHEESVSKELYADYSVFRKRLFENLTKNNPTIDKLTLFSKTQTLIDRFLFILFAEDKGLLPPNSVNRIIERFNTLREEDAYKPLYEIYRQYFGYMNIGRKGKRATDNIPAYNGGLFYPDKVLYSLKIDDDILIDDLQKLSAYDFDTEIDVNILGHIFEHSLSEIEETTAKLKGTDVNKSKSKRKKDGIFYTPQYITQYIVDNTVGRLCEEKRNELDVKEIEFDDSYYTKKGNLSKKGRTLYEKLEDYKKWLLSLKILDPACGSGAFLNQALTFLIREHNFIIEVQTDLKKGQVSMFNIEKAVLENNLYGVDINEESVEITKLSLWLRTADRERKLSNLSSNIRCGNSLIDDPEIAGDKAFKWEKEFPEIMENGGFDVVIGNPPYVRPRNITNQEKKYYSTIYSVANNQFDLYQLFIEKTKNMINEKGYFSLIIPNTFLGNETSFILRKFILNNFNILQIVDFKQTVFADASVDVLIFVFSKKNNIELSRYFIYENNDFIYQHSFNANEFYENINYNFILTLNQHTLKIFKKILHTSKVLSDFFDITTGIKEYQIGKGKPPQKQKDRDLSIFNADYKKDETFLPEIRGKNLHRYLLDWKNEYISYGKWLAEPRNPKFFYGEKLLIRQIPGKHNLILSFVNIDFVVDQTLYIAKLKLNSKIQYQYALTLLTSKLIYWFFRHQNNEFDNLFPKIKTREFKKLPIKEISKEAQQPFIEKADTMLSQSKELYELKTDFLNFLKSELKPQKITKKLANWPDSDWDQFKKELAKCKVKIKDLGLKERKEWQDYFIEQKEEADKLKSVIDSTDRDNELTRHCTGRKRFPLPIGRPTLFRRLAGR